MNFNSFTFLLFFLVFYGLYAVFGRWRRLQNVWLLVACYVFYAWFDFRYLALLGLVTLVDFAVGWAIGRLRGSPSAAGRVGRWLLVLISLVTNLGVLGFFKYFNFFMENIARLLAWLGLEVAPLILQVALPVGISFYTLRSLSYVLDVQQGRLKATGSLLNYAIYVAFFPQLLAGPIERAGRLLPQIEQPRRICSEQVSAGMALILAGYFKKLVIADNLGVRVVDPIFGQLAEQGGAGALADMLLAGVGFAFQLYADFSAYSDLARGLAYLMGFETMLNFRLPYFALNPTDFWQRWHISLSEWLRDYVFFPLRRFFLKRRWKGAETAALLVPPMVTMLVSGLWHGTGWNFILWGAYHGALMIVFRLLERKPIHNDPWGGSFPYPWVAFRMLLMFGLTTLGWLIFRVPSVALLLGMATRFSLGLSAATSGYVADLVFLVAPLLVVQVWQYFSGDLLVYAKLRLPVRWLVYGAVLIWVMVLAVRETREFIYVQF